MPRLSDKEKWELIEYLKSDKPIPDKYRFLLFDSKQQVELLWNGKSNQVTDVVLPFQTIEQIDEPRSKKSSCLIDALFDSTGRQTKGWANKLIWGDNKYILSSLKNGPLRKEIEDNGGIKLIYIDPPFDVGADFHLNIKWGGAEAKSNYEKSPNILEQIAYRDTWGDGQNSYLSMMYERLVLMRDLLSEDGSIYVHCDWRVNSLLRLVLDEVFGKHNFRNEIVWAYTRMSVKGQRQLSKAHDNILWYSKNSKNWEFNVDEIRLSYSTGSTNREGYQLNRLGSGISKEGKTVLNPKGKFPEDWMTHIPYLRGNERLGYPTQKPEKLLERIIKASSNQGDIVCDFFGGSGTTAAVSEKLNRKWICADLGKFAVHTTRKRVIEIQRDSKSKGSPYRPFELLNLGKYQREYFIYDSNEHSKLDQIKRLEKEKQFEKLVLQAYQAQPIQNFRTFSGKKNLRMVSIGPVNQPTSRLQVEEIINECITHKITKVDLLAFEYEMGLFPSIREDASEMGVDIDFKKIPSDIFDKRAIQKKEVQFYDVSYIEVKPIIKEQTLSIQLSDFKTFHNLDNLEKVLKSLRPGKNKVIVVEGNVIQVSKDKSGNIHQNALTKKWVDWIDYWSVDFDFENRKELIRVKNEKHDDWKQQWTGNYIFDNEWQSFRTKSNPKLELTTTPPRTIKKATTKVAVKVVDIFGNDTMKVIHIRMK